MLPFIVCDLDGTICDNEHRRHLVPTDGSLTTNWEKFNCACENDKPIWNTIEVLRMLQKTGSYGSTIILTGRGDSAREPTEKWLQKYDIKYDKLLMRPMGDHRDRVAFKHELLCSMGMGSLDVVFEDDDAIINMIRETFGSVVIVSPKTCIANK